MIHARPPFSIVSAPMLRSASLLVPRNRRSSWLQEWRSELWYVAEEARSGRAGFFSCERNAAAFCLGAFHDALYLRHEQRAAAIVPSCPSRSSLRTTAALFSLALFSFAVAMLIPAIRSTLRPSPYRDTGNLVLITQPGDLTYERANMPMRNLRFWSERNHHTFSDFAFYSPLIRRLHIASRRTSDLHIARVTQNLFPLLGAAMPASMPGSSTRPVLLVSPQLAQKLGSLIPAVGSEIKLGIRRVIFGGVLPADQWRLPGVFDAWLIEPDGNASSISDIARGYIVARRIPSAENLSLGSHWRMTAHEPSGGAALYEFTTLSQIDSIPATTYLFAVMLALLALPATTSLPLGEYPASSEHISWSLRLRRWLFLSIKTSLLLPTIYFVSLDLAYAAPLTPAHTRYVQSIACFLLALFSLRWTLKDQRRRCPVCLSSLTHPARVGEPSRTFLSWNGTELICTAGHGLLHIPELPTSWCATQRWLYLDSSWSRIFIGNV